MSNDPFTLDMFGNTALSSGLGLGVRAPIASSAIPAQSSGTEATRPTIPP